MCHSRNLLPRIILCRTVVIIESYHQRRSMCQSSGRPSYRLTCGTRPACLCVPLLLFDARLKTIKCEGGASTVLSNQYVHIQKELVRRDVSIPEYSQGRCSPLRNPASPPARQGRKVRSISVSIPSLSNSLIRHMHGPQRYATGIIWPGAVMKIKMQQDLVSSYCGAAT
jgi:hypothetical protein